MNFRMVWQGVRSYGSVALRLIHNNYWLIIVLAALMVFGSLLSVIAHGQILELDVLAYRFFVLNLRSEFLTPIMEGITSLAAVPSVLIIIASIGALVEGKSPGWCVTLNVAGATILNLILKELIQRPRPDGFRLISETGYSFPSGHSMVSMALFGIIIWLIWRYHKHDIFRILWCALFAVLILAIGISRIYLGVHYASDVLAGFCVSLMWLIFYTRVVAPLFMHPKRTE